MNVPVSVGLRDVPTMAWLSLFEEGSGSLADHGQISLVASVMQFCPENSICRTDRRFNCNDRACRCRARARVLLSRHWTLKRIFQKFPRTIRIWHIPDLDVPYVALDVDFEGLDATEVLLKSDEFNVQQAFFIDRQGYIYPRIGNGLRKSFKSGFAGSFFSQQKLEQRSEVPNILSILVPQLEADGSVYKKQSFFEFNGASIKKVDSIHEDAATRIKSLGKVPFWGDQLGLELFFRSKKAAFIENRYFLKGVYSFLTPLGILQDLAYELGAAYEGIGEDSHFFDKRIIDFENLIKMKKFGFHFLHELPFASSNPDAFLSRFDAGSVYSFSTASDYFSSDLLNNAQSKSAMCNEVFGTAGLIFLDLLKKRFGVLGAESERFCKNCGAQLVSGHRDRKQCTQSENQLCYSEYERRRKALYRSKETSVH